MKKHIPIARGLRRLCVMKLKNRGSCVHGLKHVLEIKTAGTLPINAMVELPEHREYQYVAIDYLKKSAFKKDHNRRLATLRR